MCTIVKKWRIFRFSFEKQLRKKRLAKDVFIVSTFPNYLAFKNVICIHFKNTVIL